MSELHAALGVAQMEKVSGFLAQRKLNFEKLEGLLSAKLGLTVLPQPFNLKTQSSFYCLSFILPENLFRHRSKIMSRLTDLGIGSSIYYPKPVPEMLYYKAKYNHQPGEFPNAKNISEGSIALPVGPHLVEDDMDKIFETLTLALKEKKYG
jgi:dTDP-4-amino-4,6-dideoxygalactose transaminase